MSLIELTQAEAEALLKMAKHHKENNVYLFPGFGGTLRIPLVSNDGREEFMLDLSRGRIALTKNTFQTRARKTIVLARIDLGGPPHTNPDGKQVLCPHIHIYREGFGDKWAIPLPDNFSDSSNIGTTLDEFMSYCNINTKPQIQMGII